MPPAPAPPLLLASRDVWTRRVRRLRAAVIRHAAGRALGRGGGEDIVQFGSVERQRSRGQCQTAVAFTAAVASPLQCAGGALLIARVANQRARCKRRPRRGSRNTAVSESRWRVATCSVPPQLKMPGLARVRARLLRVPAVI